MDPDTVFKIASQGGAPALIVGVIAWVFVKYLLPLMREALDTHRTDLAKIMDAHKAAQTETVTAFNATLDRFERQSDKQTAAIMGAIGQDVKEIRSDMDKIASAVTDLASRTDRFLKTGTGG